MSIRLYLEENNPAVERVIAAVADVPEYERIKILEMAAAWLKTATQPHPLSFVNPHIRRLSLDGNYLLDANTVDTSNGLDQLKQNDQVVRK
jgi:hypothetical protein